VHPSLLELLLFVASGKLAPATVVQAVKVEEAQSRAGFCGEPWSSRCLSLPLKTAFENRSDMCALNGLSPHLPRLEKPFRRPDLAEALARETPNYAGASAGLLAD
jgi:hypothetical protein